MDALGSFLGLSIEFDTKIDFSEKNEVRNITLIIVQM